MPFRQIFGEMPPEWMMPSPKLPEDSFPGLAHLIAGRICNQA